MNPKPDVHSAISTTAVTTGPNQHVTTSTSGSQTLASSDKSGTTVSAPSAPPPNGNENPQQTKTVAVSRTVSQNHFLQKLNRTFASPIHIDSLNYTFPLCSWLRQGRMYVRPHFARGKGVFTSCLEKALSPTAPNRSNPTTLKQTAVCFPVSVVSEQNGVAST